MPELDHSALEDTHKQLLEEEIVNLLSERLKIDLASAMDLYYRSKLASQIADGDYGIQYLDAHNLVDDLLENEIG
ncbi:MAG: hypothetical protein LBL67_00395 [Coriobacteriales bacterium]|jgi:squalene cyclase|nr:hypothetical protein [Coriobacteriales bacterium]